VFIWVHDKYAEMKPPSSAMSWDFYGVHRIIAYGRMVLTPIS
jgi:hypothetical protein